MADLILDEALAHSFDQFDENSVQRQGCVGQQLSRS